ncbi:MAG: phosphoribosylanthranilate isomerase [Kiritimatiellaeota bacterium]|nr:phosphoribosylanthranilate isomerase [Kiritimatiellota bacterium]
MRLPAVKICGIRNRRDLDAALAAGPDAVGFLVGRVHASPDFITPQGARELALSLPCGAVSPVLVTHVNDPERLERLVDATGIRTVQLHGAPTPKQVCELRNRLGAEAVLLLAVHIRGPCVDGAWPRGLPRVDALVFDTADPATDRVGGTGRAHDWRVSARLVRDCPLPVLLAGGLTPENVVCAIRAVRPDGVDVNSGVEDDCGDKSVTRCRAFVAAAREELAVHHGAGGAERFGRSQ